MRLRPVIALIGMAMVLCASASFAGQIEPRHDRTITKPLQAGIRSVIVQVDSGFVKVASGRAAVLTAHQSWDNNEPSLDVSIKNGVLKIVADCKENQPILGVVVVSGFNNCTQDLTLTLPTNVDLDINAQYGAVSVAKVSGVIKLVSGNGDVHVSEVHGRSLDAHSYYGQVQADHVVASKVSLHSDNGDVGASTVTSSTMTVESSYGSLTAERIHSDSLALRADNGQVGLDSLSTNTLEVNAGYGVVTGKALHAAKLTVSDKNGDVDIATLTAPTSATISSNYGNVALSVPSGRYAVSATTDYGKVTLEGLTVDRRAGRYLDVHSDNGDVTVSGSR